MEIFAVAGKPILHSMSPILFKAAYDSKFAYTRIIASSATEILTLTNKLNISGLNITAPFKDIKLWDKGVCSAEVMACDATNTIMIKNGEFFYHNSDVDGVRNSIQDAKGKFCVVVGAGGAAVAAAYALKSLGGKVMVINRTESKAQSLASKIRCEFAPFGRLEERVREADIVVSTVDLISEEWIGESQIYIDAQYAAPTLECKVKAKGAHYIDGYQWLINQAVVSYRIFTGEEPNIEAMKMSIVNYRAIKSRVSLVGNFYKLDTLSHKLSAELGVEVSCGADKINGGDIVIGVCDTAKIYKDNGFVNYCDAIIGTFDYSIDELTNILYAEISRVFGN